MIETKLGNNLEVLQQYPDNTFTAIVTDPPYGLSHQDKSDILICLQSWLDGNIYSHSKKGFMNNEWDSFVPGPEVWRECYRVLKPGGYILVFAGTRTQDLMGISLRLAGFEYKDEIQWVYGAGFPKGLNIKDSLTKKGSDKSDKWEGYSIALKPAHEPILLMQKPVLTSITYNCANEGCGALNINGCRVPTNCEGDSGRWPSNLILQHGYECKPIGQIEIKNGGYECSDTCPIGLITKQGGYSSSVAVNRKPDLEGGNHNSFDIRHKKGTRRGHTDKGSVSRYFLNLPYDPVYYCGKATPTDRGSANTHPTVKPLNLMKYLLTLVKQPEINCILDPFAGSGTTLLAAKQLGLDAVGIELNPEYVDIINTRLIDKDMQTYL